MKHGNKLGPELRDFIFNIYSHLLIVFDDVCEYLCV